ncbi:MAG: 3-dehydroquinate synthase [Chloroflexi bacterium]|jgi:3-dehydroquinate synthase|nr:3-dehydroquinate synthase [Chloroflexota bacterium]MBT3862884.1 3-dehydroquinate synthase [Chloroflexota bacterium]MBT4143541.1 3-dehydroquinate synthase [Chloroflexota bacterium]MBT4943725.1 3-dehydroquinate synthase [Chloroflexota bacterium]MBT5253656.1 3-dehydroquinate synthase [Chloroflexota bacterium]
MTNQDQNLAAIVNTTQGSYRVVVGRNIVHDLGIELAKTGLQGRAFLVADEAMFPNPTRKAQEALERGGYETHLLALEIGEKNKNVETVQVVYEWLADLRVERGDIIVAMGGGVTGDLVGFVAATWLRGVAVVHVPTSLAAMVDSSIGGKTGVNIPTGKNLVGAFHQPKLVLQDVAHLKSLPAREMSAGWAEAVKHGFILDAQLLDMFERLAPQMKALEGEEPVEAIRRSVAIKGEIVSADEFETGDQRILLNYGHTVGHAIEKVSGYGTYLHGEAVAVGMMVAAGIAERLGMIDTELVDRQRRVLQSYDLPVRISELDVDELINATKSDKKSRGGTIRWVLLEGPGKATTRRDVPDDVVREAILSVLD